MNDIEKALMADGEKLTQMTGEDHGPVFIYDPDDIYSDIADPTVTAWQCPVCGRYEYHVFGFSCDECGWSADDARVADALAARAALAGKEEG